MVERNDKFELYQQFAANRAKSKARRMVPFAATMAVEMPLAVIPAVSSSVAHAVDEFSKRNPEEAAFIFAPLMVALGVTSVGALIEWADITRQQSRNGQIALQIADIENQDLSTSHARSRAIRKVTKTVEIANKIGPSTDTFSTLTIDNVWTKIRRRKNPAASEDQAIGLRQHRKLSVNYADIDKWSGYKIDPEMFTNALILANKQWVRYVEDETHPEDKRRYGVLMQQEIQKKLAEHLAGVPTDETTKSRARYERMSPNELGTELLKSVLAFPYGKSSLDHHIEFLKEVMADDETIHDHGNEWKKRDESQEKKIAMEKIRRIVAQSPTTRACKEIFMRELGFIYNAGLKIEDKNFTTEGFAGHIVMMAIDPEHFNIDNIGKNAIKIPTLEEELFAAIGLTRDGEFANLGLLFDPTRAQEVERRIYGVINNRHQMWEKTDRYTKDEISNPVKRWMSNRGTDVIDGIFTGARWLFGRESFMPALERSWIREYKRKYKEKLKPL